jgi:hypothetical protein
MNNRKLIEKLNHELGELLKENTELKKTIEKYREIVEGRPSHILPPPLIVTERKDTNSLDAGFNKEREEKTQSTGLSESDPPPFLPPPSVETQTKKEKPNKPTTEESTKRKPEKPKPSGPSVLAFDPEKERKRLRSVPVKEKTKSERPSPTDDPVTTLFDSIYNAMEMKRQYLKPEEPDPIEKESDFDAKYQSRSRPNRSQMKTTNQRRVRVGKRF